MTATTPGAATAEPTTRKAQRTGLITFAGVMLTLGGAINLLDGIVALLDASRFDTEGLLFGSLSAWGVWWLCMGAVLLLTGITILTRSVWGLVFGVTVAGINAITHMFFIAANPGWSLVAMAVDGLIIYALTTRADEFIG